MSVLYNIDKSIEDLAETLRSGKKGEKKGDRKLALLLGAGCSAKAGIPTAAGIVSAIEEQYPARWAAAQKKDYPNLMSCLHADERRELITGYVENAKLNWGHIAIAQLIADGYVDRVLTTNFDPLVARACALLGKFPAIYDIAVSEKYNPSAVEGTAIIHLHGQHTGFALLNTEREVMGIKKKMHPVFLDTGRRRTWVVCGYSGACDSVVDVLANVAPFDGGLYWVGYRDAQPSASLRRKIFRSHFGSAWVSGYDADSFFVKLAQLLGCFPPTLIERPISHLLLRLESILEYDAPETGGFDPPIRLVEGTKNRLIKAQPICDEGMKGDGAQDISALTEPEAGYLYMKGAFQTLVDRWRAAPVNNVEIRNMVSVSAFVLGNKIFTDAREDGSDYVRTIEMSSRYYEMSLELKPDFYQVYNNWGVITASIAMNVRGEPKERYWIDACSKFISAISLNIDFNPTYFSWGNAIYNMSSSLGREKAAGLWMIATARYKERLKRQSEDYKAFENWGLALIDLATIYSDRDHVSLDVIRERLLIADSFRPGFVDYELACVAALSGHYDETKKRLRACANSRRLPNIEHLRADKDLHAVRSFDWFDDILKLAEFMGMDSYQPLGGGGAGVFLLSPSEFSAGWFHGHVHQEGHDIHEP